MSYGRVYMVTNKVNGKQYVGQTVTPHSRRGHGHAMKDAYKKYGFYSFEYQPIVSGDLTDMQLDAFEKFWVNVLDTVAPNGYNLESGGRWGKYVYHTKNAGKKHSQEHKDKIGASLRKLWKENPGKHNMIGAKLTEEHKRKIGLASKGKKHTEETKAKMSEIKRQYWAKLKESK